MLWLIFVLPWALYGLIMPFALRRRPQLREASPPPDEHAPLVSVIVPARESCRR